VSNEFAVSSEQRRNVSPRNVHVKNECSTNLQFQVNNVGMFRLEIFIRVAQQFPFECADTMLQGTK
jgi:hypothetical protein